MKKKLIILLIIIISLFISGCSTEPTYYSRDEVIEYVNKIFGNSYKLQKINTLVEGDKKNPQYEYIFKEKHSDFTFSVTSYTYNISLDASETIFYDKGIKNNFINEKVAYHSQKIDSYLNQASFSTNRTEYATYLYLDSYTQLEEAANLITKIDQLVAFEYNYKNWKSSLHNENYGIYIYLKPNIITNVSDLNTWKDSSKYKITGTSLSATSKERLVKASLIEDFEYDLVDKVKQSKTACYQLPTTLLNKYPASKVQITTINSIQVSNYAMSYDKNTKNYWITNLDPCQDSDDFPYNYSNKGKFRKMVELLGGTYSSSKLEATYTIKNNTYNMKLILDESNKYKDMKVTKNNTKILLSNTGDKRNGTVSGRAYTKEDLERLLNVKIIIDQNTATATIILVQ